MNRSAGERAGFRSPGHPSGAVVGEEGARELNERLAQVVEWTADAVLITALDGTIVYVNPAFETVTGYTREEALGQTPRLLRSGHHDVPFYQSLWRTVLAGGVFRGTLVNRRKNGDLFHAEHTISPIVGADGACEYLVAIARDITERLRNERHEAELACGREVQRRLYPREAPRLAGYDIAGAAHPAAFLCGDYYDFVPMAGGGLGLTIADVCGHGVGPSILMAQARAYLRMLALSHADAGEVLRRLNDTLTVEGSQREFVTQILVRLAPDTRTMTYANAGHPSGLLVARNGEVRRTLSSCDVPLGTFPDRAYPSSETIPLEPADVLVLFSDGYPESCNARGEELGSRRILDVVRSHLREPAPRILEAVYDAALAFRGSAPQVDDMTAIVCKLDEAS